MALEGDTLATARVKLIADARTLPEDVRKQTEKGLAEEGTKAGSQFGKRMALAIGASLAVGAAVVGKKLVSGLRDSITAASDLNEVSSKVGVVFGKGAKDIQKFSDTAARSLGQSKTAALDAAATFAVYGKGAQLTGKDLVNFSKKLVTTSSDMASFSNSTPEEAVTAIGAALRGEFDPIERYGVLLNQASVNAEAMRLGLVKTTKSASAVRAAQLTVNAAQTRYNEAVKEHGAKSREAQSAEAGLIRSKGALTKATHGTIEPLTSQQRVLAVQSLILKQTSDAQGDFARTSNQLANQQRIAAAQTEDLKTKIGQALLPAVLKITQAFNNQVIPALNAFWTKHGPAVAKVVETIGLKFAAFVTALASGDFSGKLDGLVDTFNHLKASAGPALRDLLAQIKPAGEGIRTNLVPALKDLKQDGGQTLADAINVGAVALKFFADHSDLLAKALPYLVGGLAAFKVAQLGSNIAMSLSPAIRILEIQATRKQTAAIVANTAAKSAETAVTGTNSAVMGANAAATNLTGFARVRATASTIAMTAATTIANVATKIWTVSTKLLGLAMKGSLGPIGIIITVVAALVAGIIYAYKHNETFRKVVQAVWAAVKVAIKAVGDWFTGVLWPSLKRAFDQLMDIFHALQKVSAAVWGGIRAYIKLQVDLVLGVFNALKNFITKTLPDAFRTGVAAIAKFWGGVQEAAKKPVTFVVNSIINPLINGFNKVAGVFGVKNVPTIGGFADGGQIPGQASSTDNRWAWLRDKAGRVLGTAGLATGEFVVNARDTAKALPLLRWINSGMKGGADGVKARLGRPLTDKPGDGSEGWAFAGGGLVGFLKDVWGAVSNPAELIKKPIEAMLSQIPGGGSVRELLVGMGHKLISGLTSFLGGGGAGSGDVGKAQTFLRAQNGKPYIWASAGPRGYDCSGIVSAVYNILHGRNPYSHTFSTGSLPGKFFPKPNIGGPLSAAWSHPGQRGASPGTGHMMGMVGGLTFESSGSRGVHLGNTTRRLTDFAHIGHYDNGGLVRRYDSGGLWPSGTLGVNTSGRTEHVTTGKTMDDAVVLLRAILDALLAQPEAVAAGLGQALAGGQRAALVSGRAQGRRFA